MDQTDKNLFQIGEVTKALGVTRRMLINYEELGLLTPAVRHDNRGFRYYSADNMVHIRIIRTLQDLGLSLPEIRSYFDDTTHLDEQISRLILLRSQLNQYIAQLQLSARYIPLIQKSALLPYRHLPPSAGISTVQIWKERQQNFVRHIFIP